MPKCVTRVGEFLTSVFVLVALAMNQWVQGYLEQILSASGVHVAMALMYGVCAAILIFYWLREVLPNRTVLLAFAIGSVLFALREVYQAVQ